MTTRSAYHIPGLCCAAEESTIRKHLGSRQGVQDITVQLVTKKIEVRHSCPEADILRSLREIGLPGIPLSSAARSRTPNALLRWTVAGGFLFVAGLTLEFFGAPGYAAVTAYLASIVVSGWRIARKAVASIFARSLDMNFLMTAAVIGAVAIGEYAEGAAVIVLFAVSLLLESLASDRSRRAIESLMQFSPPTAAVRTGGSEAVVPVEEVAPGQIIVVRPGERIPLDGHILTGASTVDQSAVTGESVPAAKQTGDTVYAGTLNQRGVLEVRVMRAAGDSTIARIARMVEDAQSRKAPSQTFIERFARVYTPAVFLLAIGVALVPPLITGTGLESWFYRALVLLVIACPCALVISTPVSVINAITSVARTGVLIKGGVHLETLAGIRTLALDKTGTATTGLTRVTDVVRLNSMTGEDILRIAARLEANSEHHLAAAILRKAESDGLAVSGNRTQDFQAIPGRGVRASIDGSVYLLGNHPLVEELGLCTPRLEAELQRLESEGKTAVVLTNLREPVGVIGIADEVRPDGQAAVRELHRLGIAPIALLTGDNRRTAESVGAGLGADEVHSELLPEQKLGHIRDLRQRHGRIAMVGDGINDAPALGAADVGVAMGAAGSDTALETADVVLMSDDLLLIPAAVRLGRRTLRIIKQNIVIALATKAVFLTLGVLGMTSLWFAILADDGATLVVILNSLRLLGGGPGRKSE